MLKTKNPIGKRLNKVCALCEKPIRVIVYSKGYRGGHYFGKVPLHTKKALIEALKAGYREAKIFNKTFKVMKKSPVVYKYIEYWECPKCYWQK